MSETPFELQSAMDLADWADSDAEFDSAAEAIGRASGHCSREEAEKFGRGLHFSRGVDAAMREEGLLRDIGQRFSQATDPRVYWQCVRDAWAEMWPNILRCERVSPYFLEWQFTPIEREAWNCIRRYGLPLYPQVPVGGVFIDFGDPYLQIGVELDGKAYHDRERDTARDAKLWALGWRIFRITGSESFKWAHPPTEPGFADDAPRGSAEYQRALEIFSRIGDGVLWALRTAYYRRSEARGFELAIADGALEDHRLIEFPLFDGHTNDDAEDYE